MEIGVVATTAGCDLMVGTREKKNLVVKECVLSRKRSQSRVSLRNGIARANEKKTGMTN